MTKKAIYGAGNIGKCLFSAIADTGESIFSFVDAYSHNKTLCGIPVVRPEKINEKIIIFNTIYSSEEEVIESELVKSGYTFVSFYDTLNKFPGLINKLSEKKMYWLTDETTDCDILTNDILPLFTETKSRKILRKIIQFRKNLRMGDYPYPDLSYKNQYFPPDIDLFTKEKNLRFIDGGAFQGDTLELLNKNTTTHSGKIKVVCFEPDKKNWAILQSKSKSINHMEIIMIPMGLHSETTVLKFTSNGSSSRLCENGEYLVPVTSLDETVYTFHPNYIKLDIEGAELQALKGAKNIIHDFSPTLAISLYHKKDDIIEIPLLIKSLFDDYNFYIRIHSHLCMETVLYCINEKTKQ